jgi:hypothetical protein
LVLRLVLLTFCLVTTLLFPDQLLALISLDTLATSSFRVDAQTNSTAIVPSDQGPLLEGWFNYSNGKGDSLIQHTTSVDGINWVLDDPSTPLFDTTERWEGIFVHAPRPVMVDNKLYLFYDGWSGSNWVIGLRISEDGGRTFGSPILVLTPSAAGAWDDYGVSFPQVLYDKDEADPAKRWKMWYAGARVEDFEQIGYAYSSDGINWTKVGEKPWASTVPGTWENNSMTPSYILKQNGTYFLYYAVKNPAGAYQTGLITTADPEGPPTQHYAEPILTRQSTRVQALTADTMANSRTVKVANANVFSVDEYVLTADKDTAPQLNRIVSIDSDTQLTLRDAVSSDLTTAQGAGVRSIYYFSNQLSSIWRERDKYVATVTVFQQFSDLGVLTELIGFATSPTVDGPWTFDIKRGVAVEWKSISSSTVSAENIAVLPTTLTALEDVSDKTINEDSSLNISFSVDGGTTDVIAVKASSSDQTLVPDANLSLTCADSNCRLQITPVANHNGATQLTVTATTADSSIISHSFTLNVNPVNDAPSFTKGADQTVDEDSGAQTVTNWASNISAGPNEAGQSLTFIVTGNTNPGLFSDGPALGSDGTLTYTPAPDANGSASVTVVLKDDGGKVNGGEDTSSAQTFRINVSAVNDPPVNRIPSPQVTKQNAPLIFSSANSNAISVSDIDAGDDSLRITLSTPDGTLALGNTSGLTFGQGDGANDDTMTFTGTLTSLNTALNGLKFNPKPGFSGQTSVKIITDDQGHSGSGGAKSASDLISVTVTPLATLQFSSATYGVNEDDATATITVTRAVSGSGAVSINYTSSSGTATGGTTCAAGIDYINSSGTLSWADSDMSPKSFTIPICKDSFTEGDETVNLMLSGPAGDAMLGTINAATLTIINDDLPVLLTEENSNRAIALDSVTLMSGPFSLLDDLNFSADHRRRVSLFVWRLGLLPTDNVSNVSVLAEDDKGTTYPLTVEYMGDVQGLSDVTQVVVKLPESVPGAPTDLWVKVMLRGTISNRAVISIAGQ